MLTAVLLVLGLCSSAHAQWFADIMVQAGATEYQCGGTYGCCAYGLGVCSWALSRRAVRTNVVMCVAVLSSLNVESKGCVSWVGSKAAPRLDERGGHVTACSTDESGRQWCDSVPLPGPV